MRGGLHDRDAPALLDRRHRCTHAARGSRALSCRRRAVQRDPVREVSAGRVLEQRGRHQPDALDPQLRPGAGRARRHHVHRVLDALVRHEPADHDQRGGVAAPALHPGRRGARCAATVCRGPATPSAGELAAGLLGHGEVAAPGTRAARSGTRSPAEPAEHRTEHRPLLAVHVVHEHQTGPGRTAGRRTACRSGRRAPESNRPRPAGRARGTGRTTR